jgi:hypothetical protein
LRALDLIAKVKDNKESYFLGMNGHSHRGNELSNKRKIAADDRMLVLIEEILRPEPEFADVHQEESGPELT